MSNPGPPKKLEKILGALMPPACREHVLGDLCERYRGNWQYFCEALIVLPLLVASRVRRATDPRALLIEAFATYLSFVAVAWQFHGASFLYDHSGFWRLALPALVTLGALLLFDVYWNRANGAGPAGWAKSTATALGGVLSLQLLISLMPALQLPMDVLVPGGLCSVLLVSGLRSLFDPGALQRFRQQFECDPVDPGHMSAEQIRAAAIRMQKRAQVARIAVCAGMGLCAASWILGIWRAQGLLFRLGSGVSLAGLVYSVYIFQKGFSQGRLGSDPSAARCVEFCRSHLEGRRDILRSAWPRLLGPLLAGTLIVLAADPSIRAAWLKVCSLLLATLFYGAVGWFARRRAPAFQRQIDALDVSEPRP